MSENIKKRSLRTFSILGLFALVLSAFYLSKPIATEVFKQESTAKKKLPIYSVDTPDKKLSISFDAAWGEVC